jgi:primosomal protein N'
MGTEYLEVVFNLPLKSCFSYSHPEGEERSASNLVGCRVSAPFGRRNLNGWVVSDGTVQPEGLK